MVCGGEVLKRFPQDTRALEQQGAPLGMAVEQGSAAGSWVGAAGLKGLNTRAGGFSVLLTGHEHLGSCRVR